MSDLGIAMSDLTTPTSDLSRSRLDDRNIRLEYRNIGFSSEVPDVLIGRLPDGGNHRFGLFFPKTGFSQLLYRFVCVERAYSRTLSTEITAALR